MFVLFLIEGLPLVLKLTFRTKYQHLNSQDVTFLLYQLGEENAQSRQTVTPAEYKRLEDDGDGLRPAVDTKRVMWW